jgi:hypothetical protein
VNMDDLIAFVTARLDEDEAAAKLAAREGGAWEQDDPDRRPGAISSLAGPVVYDEGSPDEYQGAHIARHDPARVLREVAAKRAIVRRCGWSVNEPDQYPNGLVSPRALLARQNLVDLAAVWNDHPDYRAEWKA